MKGLFELVKSLYSVTCRIITHVVDLWHVPYRRVDLHSNWHGTHMRVRVAEVFLSRHRRLDIILIDLNANSVMNRGFNASLVIILVISPLP